MTTQHNTPPQEIPIVKNTKKIPKKTALFSIVILLIAILGTTAPFVHMLFPKERPLIDNLKTQSNNGEITDEEYRICYKELKSKYSFLKHRNAYKFLARIGPPIMLCCCAFLILYCLRFIANPKIARIGWIGGILFLLSGIHTTLYWGTRKLYSIASYDDPIIDPLVYHCLLIIITFILNGCIVRSLLRSYNYPHKINHMMNMIITIRSKLDNLFTYLSKTHPSKAIQQFDTRLYITLDRITDPTISKPVILSKRMQHILIGILIALSILGSVAPQVYYFVPKLGWEAKKVLSKRFWKGEISRASFMQEQKKINKKNRIKKNKRGSLNAFSFHFGKSLAILFCSLFLLLISRHIHEKHAKRGASIAGISFLLISIFFIYWALVTFPKGTYDFHINYYYVMMSISAVLMILVIFQFVQSTIQYKYKMMELLHFIIGSRKTVFTALEESNTSKQKVVQAQEEFDEKLYDTLEKVTKKK